MTISADLLSRLRSRVEALPHGLRDHVYRARDVALKLTSNHRIDPERAELAMLAHDVARAVSSKELLRMAAGYGIQASGIEMRAPVLLHGPVGAETLLDEEGLDDEEILEAVRWHSTAHPSLGPLGKLVFIADKLDPRKAVAYPYQPELRRMAEEDLDLAVLEFLCRESEARLRRREPVHPVSVEAINSLLAGRK